MCGFVGFTTVDYDVETNRSIVKDMADRIIHRGPDEDGYFVNDNIAMGFRRLSIIDVAQSHQPMQNADGSVIVTFNGEIYNFQELRAELIEAGYEFHTNGDTETIVHGYEEWGVGVFKKLRGMFAIAIWDDKNKRLVLARDIFGIKPLYYHMQGDRIMYASEPKAFFAHPKFHASVNEKMLPQYLCFEYLNDSQTMFEGVHKVLPGHLMIIEGENIRERCFYKITYKIDKTKDVEEWADIIKDAFDESVRAHEIADVEIGSFLSGGIDSSLAAYCMGQHHSEGVKTFSVGYDITGSEEQRDKAENAGFKIKLDELKDAHEFAEWAGLSNKDVKVTAKEFLDIVPTEQYYMDEPLGAPSAIPLFFVSELASKEVKVVQSGEGADELFGGYWIYHDQYEFSKYFNLVPLTIRRAAGAIAEKLPPFHGRHFAMRGSAGPEKSYQRACMNFMWDEVPHVLKNFKGKCKPWEWCTPHFNEAVERTNDGDAITLTQYVDMVSYMPYDICLKADRMSMAHSLELRVPFLDKKVLDVALQLPTNCRVTKDHSKYALRRAAAHLGFPQKVADMPKQPFITPLTVWLQTDLYYARIKEAFTSEAAQKFFNVDYLVKMLDDHRSADFSTQEGRSKLKMMRIWNIYCFLCWYEVFFGESAAKLAPKTQVA